MDEDTSDINTEIEDTIADQLKIDKKNNDILMLVKPNILCTTLSWVKVQNLQNPELFKHILKLVQCL